MIESILNKAVYAAYTPSRKDRASDAIGFYSFHLIEYDPSGALADAMLYGATVYQREGHVIMDYDGGDPPSPHAGHALDLHCGAVANVKKAAPTITTPQAYFIDDDGKLAVAPLAWFRQNRAPAVVAIAPALFEPDALDLYRAVTGGGITNPKQPSIEP